MVKTRFKHSAQFGQIPNFHTFDKSSSKGGGFAFPQEISTGNLSPHRGFDDFTRSSPSRPRIMLLLLLISIAAILIKLIGVQIFQGKYWRSLSDRNRIKTIVIHAPRGIIFDRGGKPLVYNVPGYRQIVNGKTVLLSQEQAVPLVASGAQLEIDSLRQYAYKEVSAHILGYLGQISPKQLQNPLFSDYSPGDLIGQGGIEGQYEKDLRGEDGRQLFEVDSGGKSVRKLGQSDPTSGKDVTLTVDVDLQRKVFGAMKDVKKGAAVVSTPKGEILSLVSKPSFDSNLFTLGKDYKPASGSGYISLSDVLSDNLGQPLLNRAISGVYPPGSTFKIVVASAGLGDKIIDENWAVEDTGVIRIGDFSFANWYFTGYGKTDGTLNVVSGLKRSNDIFFYKLAERVGVDKISQMATIFGAGGRLGIDLAGESWGLVPTPEWKKRSIGEGWYLGDTYHYGIGQGYVLSTPLQVNSWAQIIANGGTLYKPHILKETKNIKLRSNFLDKKTASLVREGMIESCSPGGVAWPLFEFKVKNENLKIDGRNFLKVATGSADLRHVVVACKTGTAEHTPGKEPHAWITLFAPAYDPQIVVTVLAEEGGEGSNVAAPIAKEILDQYFGSLK